MNKWAFCIADHPRQQKWRFLYFTMSLTNTYIWGFPALPTKIRQVEGSSVTPEISALLDTGADITFVPIGLLHSIGAEYIQPARIGTHWGDWRNVKMYMIDITVAGHQLPAIDVIGDDQSGVIILGRNVLNRLVLLLDGPNTQTDVLTRRPQRL